MNRPVVLAMIGLVWILTGLGRIQEPLTNLPESLVRPGIIGAVWIAGGVVALAAVYLRRLDVAAWSVLTGIALGQVVSYTGGWILGSAPTGWRGALAWAAITVLLNRCAAGLDRLPRKVVR